MARLGVFGKPGDPRLWVQCANAIAERIADGRYPPGQWLPDLAKICAETGTGNSAVQRALMEVCGQGLATRVHGTGYYAGTGQRPPGPRGRNPADRLTKPGHGSGPPDPRTAFLASEQYITVQEFAVFLRVVPMTIYRVINNGDLPGAVRVAENVIRIPISAAEAYLRRCAITAQLDIQAVTGQDAE